MTFRSNILIVERKPTLEPSALYAITLLKGESPELARTGLLPVTWSLPGGLIEVFTK